MKSSTRQLLTSLGLTKLINILIIILAIAAVVLGYAVYMKMAGDTESTDQALVGVVENDTSEVSQNDNFNFPALTQSEREALNPPAADAPSSAFKEHFTLVQSIAVDEGVLAIGANCTVYPVVLKTKLGKDLMLTNHDSEQHTITFNEGHTYPVPAGQSISIPVQFGQGAGLYGYGCDRGTSATGMVLVGD